MSTPPPSAIAVFREALARTAGSSSTTALEHRGPLTPPPPIPVSVATANTDAAAWMTVMTALTTSVSTAATAKLVATKNPAYAKIVSAATQLLTESTQTVGQIQAAGQAILAGS